MAAKTFAEILAPYMGIFPRFQVNEYGYWVFRPENGEDRDTAESMHRELHLCSLHTDEDGIFYMLNSRATGYAEAWHNHQAACPPGSAVLLHSDVVTLFNLLWDMKTFGLSWPGVKEKFDEFHKRLRELNGSDRQGSGQ